LPAKNFGKSPALPPSLLVADVQGLVAL